MAKGLCLIDSLERHSGDFHIYVLCLDDECYSAMKILGKDNVTLISLSEIENATPGLSKTKDERSKVEYYFTCGPAFIRYVVSLDKAIDIITYLDSDLYFFSSPAPLFSLFEGKSIGVMGNHLPEHRKKRVWQGLFNVGWISFRCDEQGISCLEWWKDRCLEWCFERLEDGKYADQLYLDKWPRLYPGFYEFVHHGSNVAPWNLGDRRVSKQDGRVFIDSDPLIFFHFHGIKKISRRIYNTNLVLSLKPPSPIIKDCYREYIDLLEKYSFGHDPTKKIRQFRGRYFLIKAIIRTTIGFALGQYLLIKPKTNT
jgi:hypothetical protein